MADDLLELSELSPGDDTLGPGGLSTGNPSTGDLRRKYNFGDRVSELSIAQDPFFRFLSKAAKKPTDDPTFKFTTKRPSWHKRYAYVTGWINSADANISGGEATGANLTSYDAGDVPTSMTAGTSVVKLYMAADYKSEGNIQMFLDNQTMR